MAGDDRGRGILSSADREYLRGETTFGSIQAERNARARIRDRVYEATLDLELLVDRLDPHDRKLVFEKRFDEMAGAEAFDALVSAMAFYYRATADTDLAFGRIVEEAVNLAEAENERAATVDVEITHHALSAEELLRKLKTGESLSLTELAYLQRSDEVSNDEVARYVSDDEEDPVDDGRIQSKVTEF